MNRQASEQQGEACPAEHQPDGGQAIAVLSGAADLAAGHVAEDDGRDRAQRAGEQLADAARQRGDRERVGPGRRRRDRPGGWARCPPGQVGGDPGQVAERARGKRLARPAVVLVLGQPALGVAGLEHVDGAIPVSAWTPAGRRCPRRESRTPIAPSSPASSSRCRQLNPAVACRAPPGSGGGRGTWPDPGRAAAVRPAAEPRLPCRCVPRPATGRRARPRRRRAAAGRPCRVRRAPVRRLRARAVLRDPVRLLRLQHLHRRPSLGPAPPGSPTRARPSRRSGWRGRCSARPPRPAAAVFFGGGTPTLLPPADLAAILAAIDGEFGLVPGAEVTAEANPETVDQRALARAAGKRLHPHLDRHAERGEPRADRSGPQA